MRTVCGLSLMGLGMSGEWKFGGCGAHYISEGGDLGFVLDTVSLNAAGDINAPGLHSINRLPHIVRRKTTC